MTEIVILRPEDAPRMAHLHAAAFPPGEAWSENSLSELMAQPSVIGLGVEGNLALEAVLIAQKVPPEAEILTLATAPTARRKGVATDLFNGCMSILKPYGITELRLEVAADNRPAREFYAQVGFREDGRREAYYHRRNGTRVDAILMSRAISGHGPSERA
ncbi:MAG: N-acetyltransferase [Henriciella sp.]|nr:N-acetyltransferase [Henriciella sp.]